ncbi:MAG: hypothetical protein WCT23_00845 [Candidatus Neomarinimicrobiota bacterium]
MAKITYLFICMIHCISLSGVAWNTSGANLSVKEKHQLNYIFSPVCYPDTFCLATSWSPIYQGFGIHEGIVYLGWQNVDFSLKSQVHPLMSNHELSAGFKILDQEQIKAGLQFHYAASFLYDHGSEHEGAVSGAVSVYPKNSWELTFYSLRFLSFPHDSACGLFEAQSGLMVNFDILPSLSTVLGLEKRDALPWELLLNMSYSIIPPIAVFVSYKIQSQELSAGSSFCFGRWQILWSASYHEYLGFKEDIFIAYKY